MKIGGFQLPKIDLGKVLGSSLSGIKQTLQKAAGEFFKSGFEGAKKSLFQDLAKQQGIQSPPTNLGSKSPSVSANSNKSGAGDLVGTSASNATNAKSNDPRSFIRDELGEEAIQDWDKMPKSARDDLQRQAALQRASRTTQMMTSLLQALHEMNKSIIQNLRA